jgi:hypothetical protein
MAAYSNTSWSSWAADRWGHAGANILIASIVVAMALGIHPPAAGSAFALAIPLLLFAVVICSWLRMREHDRGLCEICVQEMPLAAAEIAERLNRRFTLAHLAERRELVLAYLVLLLGSNALLLLGLPGRLGWALAQSSMIYLVLSYSSHRRFQPWCPQCRGGGSERRASADQL